MFNGLKIIDSLGREIDALESLRGFILWNRAPVALADAVQSALDALNEAAEIAAKWNEQRENLEMLNELKTMLVTYKSVKEAVVGTNERLGKVAETCAACNAGLDAIFAEFAEGGIEGEAAPNGELSDGGAESVEGAPIQ